MKKIFSMFVGMAVTVTAIAQDWQDARFFAENNYIGTARTLGMGNAVTAIGGDPGSIGINPAGSAVASYSQFVISPGVTISTVGASGVVASGASSAVGLGDQVRSNYGRFSIPNVGAIFSMDSGRRYGWKRMAFGLMMNSTNNFTGRVEGSGINEDNSYAASLASSAEGYTEEVLGTESWWYEGSDPARLPKWIDMVGYRSGMFNGIEDAPTYYQAVTELRDKAGNLWLAAPIYQKYGQQTWGGKNDIVFNFAANYNDQLYLGVNIGVTTLSYGMTEYFYEAPENPDTFPVIEYSDGTVASFSSLQMKHAYDLSGSGIYAKLGVLWRPVAGLRLGAAFQTPTLMNLTARQSFSGETVLVGRGITPSTSPQDSWTYAMTSPLRFNVGAAYSLGQVAVLSADYEFVNYGSIRYRSIGYGTTPTYLQYANSDIQDALGVAHQLRVGAEVKPVPQLALRAGYNLLSYGQKNWLEEDWTLTPLTSQEKRQQLKHQFSLGAGYSFGAFFLDAAVRMRVYPKEYLVPYYYYNYSYYTEKHIDPNILTPEIEMKPMRFDVVLTAGWRF